MWFAVLASFLFALPYMIEGAEITKDQFDSAVKANGAPVPHPDVYRYFTEYTKSFSLDELAMFLAQLIHESGGFRYKEELQFRGKKNHGHYVDKVGLAGKDYHGRGFIQLTWGENYKAASQDLGLGDKLLKNPELVATDTSLAMQVSVWYWQKRVAKRLAEKKNCFGVTTKAINPGECWKFKDRAQKRYQIYLKVAFALNINNVAKEDGCYN